MIDNMIDLCCIKMFFVVVLIYIGISTEGGGRVSLQFKVLQVANT